MADTIVAVINVQGVLNDVVDSNIEILVEEGFLVADKKKVVLLPEQAMKLNVPEAEMKLFYSGPVVILRLRRDNAFEAMHSIYPQLDDFYYTHTPYLAIRDEHMLFPTQPLLERTLAVVKPGYSQEEYTAILDAIAENNFVVLGKVARVISPDVASQLVGKSSAADVAYLSSEVSVSLVLEKLGAVDDWRLLLGPEDPEEARTHAPYSIRARLGQDLVRNVAYGSSSANKASADVVALFPHPFSLERSVALVKPDAVQHVSHIIDSVRAHGFTVIAQDRITLSKTRCEALYGHLKSQPYYNELISYMSAGECVPLLLSKPAAIASLRVLVGPADPLVARKLAPRSLRALFAADSLCNAVDASSDAVQVDADVAAFFPRLTAERVPTADEVEVLLSKRSSKFRPGASAQPKSLRDVLAEGLAQLCRVKLSGNEALRWLALWLLRNNPSKPQVTAPDDSDDEAEEAAASAAVGTVAGSGKSVVTVVAAPSHREAVVVEAEDEKENNSGVHAAPVKQTGARVITVHSAPPPPKMVWALGAPGTGEEVLVPALGAHLGMDVVHVPSLLQAAEAQNTEYGRVLAAQRRLGRPPPSHIIVSLIHQAVAQASTAAHAPNGFLLAQFPQSLDDAFAFERVFGAPSLVLALSCNEEAALTRMLQAQATRSSAHSQDALAAIKAYIEATGPVVDHYATFNKVLPVLTNDTLAAPLALVKGVVAPQIHAALRANEPKERAPRKLLAAPKKKAPVAVEEPF